MQRRTLFKLGLAATAAAVLPTTQTAAAGTVHTVKIREFAFWPSTLKVKIGDTIMFQNFDSTAHTATARGKSWDTGTLRMQQTGEIAVTAGITTHYYCRFHPNMQGKLKIVS